MQAVAAGHKSVVERMMLADTKLWKGQWTSDIGSCISKESVKFSAININWAFVARVLTYCITDTHTIVSISCGVLFQSLCSSLSISLYLSLSLLFNSQSQ